MQIIKLFVFRYTTEFLKSIEDAYFYSRLTVTYTVRASSYAGDRFPFHCLFAIWQHGWTIRHNNAFKSSNLGLAAHAAGCVLSCRDQQSLHCQFALGSNSSWYGRRHAWPNQPRQRRSSDTNCLFKKRFQVFRTDCSMETVSCLQTPTIFSCGSPPFPCISICRSFPCQCVQLYVLSIRSWPTAAPPSPIQYCQAACSRQTVQWQRMHVG